VGMLEGRLHYQTHLMVYCKIYCLGSKMYRIRVLGHRRWLLKGFEQPSCGCFHRIEIIRVVTFVEESSSRMWVESQYESVLRGAPDSNVGKRTAYKWLGYRYLIVGEYSIIVDSAQRVHMQIEVWSGISMVTDVWSLP
jgi:hypothetical protein